MRDNKIGGGNHLYHVETRQREIYSTHAHNINVRARIECNKSIVDLMSRQDIFGKKFCRINFFASKSLPHAYTHSVGR